MPDLTPFEARLAELLEADSIAGLRPVDRYAIARAVIRDRAGRRWAGPSGDRRWLMPVVLATLLVALLAGAAILVGSQLLGPRPAALIPPDRGVFTPTGSMGEGRGDTTATLLRDGRVLVVGGFKHFNDTRASAEIWDPVTGKFTLAGTLAHAREGHTATLLRDGRVLVVGGYGPSGSGPGGIMAFAEIWDPATMRFSPTGSLATARALAQALLLPDGRVLVNHGYGDFEGPMLTSAEVWDPGTGTFGPADTLPEARYPTGTLLEDGRILVIDGDYFHPGTGATSVWDPDTRTASLTTSQTPTSGAGFTATRLQDGRVLVTGGTGSGTAAKIWDPATMSFSPTGSLGGSRYVHAAALMSDGRVLVVGNNTDDPHYARSDSAELFELR